MFSLVQRLPVRIDISWLKSAASGSPDAGDMPAATEHEMVERARLLNRIIDLNPNASTEFLEAFESCDLEAYLEHLEAASRPRGRMARWIRPDNTPGIEASSSRS